MCTLLSRLQQIRSNCLYFIYKPACHWVTKVLKKTHSFNTNNDKSFEVKLILFVIVHHGFLHCNKILRKKKCFKPTDPKQVLACNTFLMHFLDKDISYVDLKSLMEESKDLLLVDVRTKDEVDKGCIPGSIHIPGKLKHTKKNL